MGDAIGTITAAGVTITVDMNKNCAECGKGGAVDNGLCLGCTAKAMGTRPLKSAVAGAVRRRMRDEVKRR